MEGKQEEINKEKFVRIPDEELIVNKHAIMLPNGKIFEIGIHAVIFGYRVVGGFQGTQSFEINWCCGNNKLILHMTQKVLMNLIEQGTPIFDIPFASDIKPWPKDKEFIERVAKLVKNPVLGDIATLFEDVNPQL